MGTGSPRRTGGAGDGVGQVHHGRRADSLDGPSGKTTTKAPADETIRLFAERDDGTGGVTSQTMIPPAMSPPRMNKASPTTP